MTLPGLDGRVVSLGGVLLLPGALLTQGLLGALTVEPKTPEAFCPPQPVLEAVLRERLGNVEDDYRLQYSVTRNIARHETTLQVVLLGPSGAEVLERRIPLGPDGCAGAAQLIAQILEAHWSETAALETPNSAGGPQVAEQPREVSPEAPKGVPTTETTQSSSETTGQNDASRSAQEAASSRPAHGDPLRRRDETPIGAKGSELARSRRPETPIVPQDVRLRAAVGLGPELTFPSAGGVAVWARVPLDRHHWVLQLGLATPFLPADRTVLQLGLQVKTLSPAAFAQLAYQVVESSRTGIFLGVGFLGLVELAWIEPDATRGIYSEGTRARILGAPSLGVGVSYLMTPEWEFGFTAIGGPTPLATSDFTFASIEGQSTVLPPEPIVGLAALTLARRL